jgi:N-acetylmuramoyl-L-alanine amidase
MDALNLVERPSPNHDQRPSAEIRFLILHYTGMASTAAALERLCDPHAKVSAHYLIEEDGRVWALVPEHRRAWHAGVSFWKGERDINGYSIGIEIANGGHDFGLPPYPDVQMRALEQLCHRILSRHSIKPACILGHSDVAPMRKADPGEKFDWARLARAGIGVWVEPEPVNGDGEFNLREGDKGGGVQAWQAELASYGYELPVTGCYDMQTKAVTTAFQRHFRPARTDGEADVSTRVSLARLLAIVSRGS